MVNRHRPLRSTLLDDYVREPIIDGFCHLAPKGRIDVVATDAGSALGRFYASRASSDLADRALGVLQQRRQAPYDHINAAEAMRSFIQALPNTEQDYLEALRAYSDTLYGRMLATSDAKLFVDKTPANALVLPFLAKLYPDAKYIVLTRHPLAVFSSYANSFFGGDWAAAHAFNPILERYVPAIAKFLKDRPVDMMHVAYDDVVQNTEAELKRLFAFLAIPNQSSVVDYGDAQKMKPAWVTRSKWITSTDRRRLRIRNGPPNSRMMRTKRSSRNP